MPDTPPPVAEALDMQALLTLMTRTLGAMTESRTNVGNNISKLEVCPVKRMSSSLDSWILWDESNSSNVSGWKA